MVAERGAQAATQTGERPGSRPSTVFLVLVGVLAAAALAVGSGLAAASGEPLLAVVPVALVAAVALGVLATTQVMLVVLLLLAARTSLDLVSVTGGGGVLARALDPAGLASLLLIATTASWLLVQRVAGRRLRGAPLRTALLALLAAAALSLVGADAPAAGAAELLRLGSAVAMLVLLEQVVTSRRWLLAVLGACGVALVVPLALGIGQLLGVVGAGAALEGGPLGLADRLTGSFDHPTTYARYLMVAVLGVTALLPALGHRARWALTPVTLVAALLLAATLTRGALLAGAVGLLVVVVLQRRWLLAAAAAGAGVVALVGVPGLQDRFATLSEPTDSLAWRVDYWAQVLPMATERPLTGIGLDGVRAATAESKLPHSDLVRTLVETGLLGAAAYLAVLVALATVGLRGLRRTDDPLLRAVCVAATATGTAVAVASLAANVLTGVVVLWYAMALAACASAVGRGLLDGRDGSAGGGASVVGDVAPAGPHRA
ncbi:O-antigen ligase family protein [Pseudokineococcus sp. 1T1Z-3]|uniref:O-antigen ligase family protein n=1 Tax=Pseudokineococcus sp. 1T1Z-3 TaxID=3132745 RepID=UPI0030A60B8F